MPKSRTPSPPETNNPIVYLQSQAALRQEWEFLDEFLTACDVKDVDRAARCAISAISAPRERSLVIAMTSVVNNLAHEEDSWPKSVTEMLCKASDAGFHEFAYNAGNRLMEGAKSVKRYREAERYYKLAMAYADEPEMQAAAHVNYCSIIRDGLISGKPDWARAVEIYETAARMGLVKGMFNAGNVSAWLANQGDREYGARAVYWFEQAIEFHAAQKPKLDFETWAELDEVIDACVLELSACHIDSKFDGADLDEGIRLARQLADKGHAHGRHNLGVGYTNRLTALSVQPQATPGANWRAVLSQMDWTFSGDVTTRTHHIHIAELRRTVYATVDRILVDVGRGRTLPLFVTHEHCLPFTGGLTLLEIIANALVQQNPEGFFLVSRKAVFVPVDRRVFTPIYVFHDNEFSQQSLWLGCSPSQLIEQARADVDFLDKSCGASNCILAIAVNALDEGYVVARDASLGQPYVDVGDGYCLPYLDKHQLPALGIEDENLPDGLRLSDAQRG